IAQRTSAGLTTSGAGITSHEYSLGAQTVSWELDLFGKIRSQAESAHQTYLSDADTMLSARIALVAQMASEYYTWLADRESLKIAQDTAAADQKSLQLTQLEAANGTTTAIAVAQAQTTYDTAMADVAQFQRQTAQDMDELVLLAGAPLPAALVQKMDAVSRLSNEPPLPRVPAGLPSDLLTRRPDIRAAEHELLAANANIGAARAAFFPSISLTANGGVASSSLSSLFSGGTTAWLFEPQITLPIFTGGANLANLDLAKLEKQAQIANYEATIQSAFHDVSDALVARQTYVDQVQAEQNLVAADTRYYTLAQMRFNAGIDNYLNVLLAQDSLLSARLTLVSLQLAQQQNEITLYKALGGGWQANGASTPQG
ncbi:MAG: efflux transporter outer membrane subunit, partial [Rhodospirillales bacterium]|nr:efflux transporter outer membrane subunit [Rhodospirillales bacterium]